MLCSEAWAILLVSNVDLSMYKADAINSVDDLINADTISEDPSQDQWREGISSVLFHAKPADLTCLDELGSRFLQMGLINASHAWYVSFHCHGDLLLISPLSASCSHPFRLS